MIFFTVEYSCIIHSIKIYKKSLQAHNPFSAVTINRYIKEPPFKKMQMHAVIIATEI
jgi:hypothetical protein